MPRREVSHFGTGRVDRGELRVELVRRREAERGKPSRMWKRRNEGKEERKERRRRCFREDGTHFIGINAEGWRTLSVKPALKNVVMERARVWGNMRGDDRTQSIEFVLSCNQAVGIDQRGKLWEKGDALEIGTFVDSTSGNVLLSCDIIFLFPPTHPGMARLVRSGQTDEQFSA